MIQDIPTPLLELYPIIPLFESLSILHSYSQLLVLASHFLTIKAKSLALNSQALHAFSIPLFSLHWHCTWNLLNHIRLWAISHGLEIICGFCLHRDLHVYILKITFTQERIWIIFKRSELFFSILKKTISKFRSQ